MLSDLLLQANDSSRIQITVENLSPSSGGTFLTPVWVGVHDGTFDLYDRDAPNFREGLERIAEDGTTETIDQEFMTEQPNGTASVIFGGEGVPGPIDPIESASITLDIDDPAINQFLGFATMVIPSNDAFLASPGDPLGIQLFDEQGKFLGPQEFISTGNDVLDLGTEVNTEEDAAFLNQLAPDTGIDENGNVVVHPGFNGSIGNPDATPMNVLGGTTAPGPVIDPFFGDFTRSDGEVPMLRVTVTEVPGPLEALETAYPANPLDPSQVAPGSLPGDGGGHAYLTFLDEDANNNNSVGYYFYDLETGVIDEGFIAFASTEDANVGDAVKIEVGEGQGIVPFLIPEGGEGPVDFSAFANGGITFENPNTGQPASIFDGVPPTVLANGTPTEIVPFHGLDGNPDDDANPLNPGDTEHANIVELDDLTVFGFEDIRFGGDRDFDDAVVGVSGEVLDPELVEQISAILNPDGFVNHVDDGAFADVRATDGLSFEELVEVGEDGGLYVNVHSNDFASGEVRGQLMSVEDNDDSIVTLETDLTPEAEVVPPGSTDPAGQSPAEGFAQVIIDLANETYDAKIIVTDIEPSDLAPVGGPEVNSPVHLHIGGPEENGPIVINLGAPGGEGDINPLMLDDGFMI
ncbi:MAG: spondin domain-containing protein [Pseudomonadota bacterium]